MNYSEFSPKQRTVLTWWTPGSPYAKMEAIVCDGAVRSGKTMSMGLGFFLWAMASFDGQRFGVCGKTIASLRRNVLSDVLPRLKGLGATWKEKRTENLVRVRFAGTSRATATLSRSRQIPQRIRTSSSTSDL